MSLFQKPPTTAAELEQNRPLAIPPEEVAAMDEAEWYARAFRGEDAIQLTVRAVVMGCVLGFFLAFTNVYVGLKVGWGLGVSLTACIASFTIWSTLVRLGAARSPMTILENNCMQSTASSAGYSTTSLLVTAVPAMLLLSVTDANPLGTQMKWSLVMAWVVCVGALGVLMAIPMKRAMINRERLKFPSGTAAAVLLQSLYSEGAEALAKGRALLASGAVGVLVPLLTQLDAFKTVDPAGHATREAALPSDSKIFDWLPKIRGYPVSAWNVVLDHSLVLVAAGAIVGLRTTLSMAAGGLLLVLGIGPYAMGAEWTNPSGHVVAAVTRPGAAWKEIGIWFGAPLMVAYGLVTFALGFRAIGRALSDLRASREAGPSPADAIEVPFRWFVVGTAVSGTLVVILGWQAFDIPLHYGALAVFMTFFLALVACRATGETDITPIGAMGKIMQLTYGALIPQNYAVNLMTASITSSASAEAADLLNDLKSGYLLGAHPRRQFIAQFLGIFSGTIASVLCYFLLVPDATVLTGRPGAPPQFAAPAAQQWRAVAELFRVGIGNLHPLAREGIAVGLCLGTALAILEWLFPRGRAWLPSATGIGLGMLLPFATSISFVLGAGLAWAFERVNARQAQRFVVPISSGLIAGESIVGVVVAALNNFVLK
ncbi:MAG TPA: OPT family oligopeptide transporter [Polyangiaceae bacterium]